MLKTIDYKLGIAEKKIRLLSRLNPVNVKSEKKKFIHSYITKGVPYNPLFRYKPVLINLRQLKQDVRMIEIKIPDESSEKRIYAKCLQEKKKRIIKKIECALSRGTSDFGARAKNLFGSPSQKQVGFARKHLSRAKCRWFEKIQDTLSVEQAGRMLQEDIESANLPWRVKTRSSISSKAGLDSRSNYLLLKSGERFSPEEIRSLSIHEIDTHIFRKENGLIQNLPYLFGQGLAGPPTTEEGLAFFNETLLPQDINKSGDPRRFVLICARTLAIKESRKKSFYDVFNFLVERGLPIDYAWAVTTRAKRGLSDTSCRGSFPKDQHYLRGYLEVKEYVERGGDVKALYRGKLNINVSEMLNSLGLVLAEPIYLPRYPL